jgi:hypothetical protein
MRRHEYESRYNPAATELSRALMYDGGIRPDMLDKITRVLDGVEVMDNLITQKDQVIVQKDSVINQKIVELQSTKQVLVQKEQIIAQKEQSLEQLKKNGGMGVREEFIYLLNKLSPEAYSSDFSKWSDKLPMKKHVVNNDIQVMEKNIKIYKEELEKKEQEDIKKEFIASLHERYPSTYSTDPSQWFYKTGEKVGQEYPMKVHYDNNNFQIMVKNTVTYKKEIEEINAKKLEDAKRLKEEEEVRKEQLLIDNHREIEDLKALIAQKELEKQEVLTQTENVLNSKDQLLLAKDSEMESLRNLLLQKEAKTQELLAQQEIEKQELLAQKEVELANKSLVKNQVIGELKEDIDLKEKDAYKLQIELLTKQLEAAREIGKQKEINTELVEQNEILGLKMQYYDMEVKNKEAEKEIFLTQKQKLSFLVSQKEQEFQNLLIQKEIEQKELLLAKELAVTDKSFEKNQVIEQLREEIEGLNKQLFDNQPIYRSIYIEDRSCQPGESLVERQMASLDLSSINLSPINHGEQNQIVGNIIGNFDINNVHTTNSVLISGEVSQSFEIVDTENFH